MKEASPASILEHFGGVEDPRVAYLVDHKLIDILAIGLCAVIAGADNWTEVAQFGQDQESWLAQFLELPSGIPSDGSLDR